MNVKRIPINQLGRDFVVGDIHGAYANVEQAMAAVHFDPSRDRLLSVGDLVDRGADSARCLAFLAHPGVHAVRGNHDDDVASIDAATAQVLASVNFNGMGWIDSITPATFGRIQRALANLPIVIEMETRRGLVGIVHGDVPSGMSWQEFTAAIEDGNEDVIECALRGRERIQGRDDQGVPGVGRLYVGHTIQWGGPRRLGNVYAVDTGAIFEDGALSMVDVVCATEALCRPPGVQAAPVELFEQPAHGEFGRYASNRG